MALIELIFVLIGAHIFLFWLSRAIMMLSPKIFYPLPENFFTSMGKWAVITGGSDGIGKAYAQELARHGLNVVIISRSKQKLDRVARDIGGVSKKVFSHLDHVEFLSVVSQELKKLGNVKVIDADFTKGDSYENIKKNIEDLDIAVLVNNVGILPSQVPCKLLETVDLEEKIQQVINCNIKTMVKMCHIVLPGMVNRGRGIILNISSGMAKIPFPLYTLYAATKVFVERFSQGLHAEYKSNGILIQTVSPFGVSTRMTGYQKPNWVTFTPEEFVQSSLMFLKAGEQTYGSVSHAILGWVTQVFPTCVLRCEKFQHALQEYIKKRVSTE